MDKLLCFWLVNESRLIFTTHTAHLCPLRTLSAGVKKPPRNKGVRENYSSGVHPFLSSLTARTKSVSTQKAINFLSCAQPNMAKKMRERLLFKRELILPWRALHPRRHFIYIFHTGRDFAAARGDR